MKNCWMEKAITEVKDKNFHWDSDIDIMDYKSLKQIDEETRFCRVYINGVVRGIKPSSKMTYQDVVDMSPIGRQIQARNLMENSRVNPDLVYSITYHKGVDGKDGILSKGQSVDVANEMVFNVAFTGNA